MALMEIDMKISAYIAVPHLDNKTVRLPKATCMLLIIMLSFFGWGVVVLPVLFMLGVI
jgi:hypothetical protein